MEKLKLHHRLVFLMFQSIIVSMVFVIFLLVGITTAPMVEGHLLPVVQEMNIKKLGGEYYRVTGDKVRSCKYLGMEGLVRTKTTIVKAEFTFFDSPVADRPVGHQDFGLWRIDPEGELISLFVRHQCHDFWTTTTKVS